MRVALLEDDPAEAEVIGQRLLAAGFSCAIYERANSLLCALARESVDVVVLDCMHFDAGQIDTLERVRSARRSPLPVLLISRCVGEFDIAVALAHGADDYIVKPLRHAELVARIRALGGRRGRRAAQPSTIESGSLRLDCDARTVSRDGRPIHLGAKDFDLALLLLLNIGLIVSYDEMRQAAWRNGESPNRRTLHTHVCSVRRRLDLTPTNGFRLAAVYGRGYRLERCAKVPADNMIGSVARMLGGLIAPPTTAMSSVQTWPSQIKDPSVAQLLDQGDRQGRTVTHGTLDKT